MEFQTRSEETGLGHFTTLSEALDHAKTDPTIWKISFTLPSNERVRLIINCMGRFELSQQTTLFKEK